MGLLKNLTSVRLVDCNSVEEYVNKIITTAHKLKELQFEVKDEMVAALLLSGLPDDYKPMIMGLKSSGTALKVDAVKVKILQEVQTINTEKTADQEAALYTKTHREQNKAGTVKRCFICNKPGHFAAKCRHREKKKEMDRNQTAFMAVTQ